MTYRVMFLLQGKKGYYYIDKGRLEVPLSSGSRRILPSKQAAGRSVTHKRRGFNNTRYTTDTLHLLFAHSLDDLRPITPRWATRDECPCCGTPSKGKYRLNEQGRRHLRFLKSRKPL